MKGIGALIVFAIALLVTNFDPVGDVATRVLGQGGKTWIMNIAFAIAIAVVSWREMRT
jgi:hypothetical protein